MSLLKSCCPLLCSSRGLAALGTIKISGHRSSEPIAPAPGRSPVWTELPSEIFADMQDGHNIFVHGSASTPNVLCSHLSQHLKNTDISGIKLFQQIPLGPLPYLNEDIKGKMRLSTAYASPYCREAVNSGDADFIPISTSELPLLYRMKHVEVDFALISVTPPDKHGFCSMGSVVGSARSAVQNSKRIVAQVNPHQPTTYGDSTIHMSKIDFLVHGPQQLFETVWKSSTPAIQKVASTIAENLVEDGATLALSNTSLAQEVTAQLRNHKNLGLHTECFSDGEVDLVNLGVINNRFKTVRRGRIVASHVVGTRKVFDFVNENPLVALYDIAWVNAPEVIARNPKVTVVNTAFEMDLTGQSASDSYGDSIIGGVSGMIDFIRAASLSSDNKGKPIIAMPSKNLDGKSTIVPYLTRGSGVVATRAHVHFVVTEYGIAYLFGKNLRQRAHALINIAHPDFRESLEKASFERLKCMPSP